MLKVFSKGKTQHYNYFLIQAEYRQKVYDNNCGGCSNYQVCIKYEGLVPDTDFWLPLYRCIGIPPRTTISVKTLARTTTVTKFTLQTKSSTTTTFLEILTKHKVSIQRIDSKNYTLLAISIVAAFIVIACLIAFLVFHRKYSFANILLKRHRSPCPYPHYSGRDHNRSAHNSSIGENSYSPWMNDDGTVRSKSIHYSKPELPSYQGKQSLRIVEVKESWKPPTDTPGSQPVMQPVADSNVTTCDRYNSA